MNQIPTKKRSIFSKQAFAKLNVAKDPVDFFSCAKKVYPQLLEEEDRKRQIKIKRKERLESNENEEESKKLIKDEDETVTTPLEVVANHTFNESSPRRSTPPLPQGYIKTGSPSNVEDKSSPYPYDLDSIRCPLNKKRKLLSLEKPSKQVISLDSDSEEPFQSTSDPFGNDSLSPRPTLTPVTDYQPDKVDEEYAEFIQQAREREKLKAQQRLIAASSVEQTRKTSEQNNHDIFGSEPKSALELDPTVELLITSELEGTRPLRVKRKLSQRLKEARLTWCEKQHIRTDSVGKPLEEVIFFTWKGKRLFDVTTCGSLGLKVGNGRTILPSKDGVEPTCNIHLEAWTEETLKAKEEKVAESQELESRRDDNVKESEPDKEKDPSCKLILKAKDLEPCKLVVKPTTTIGKMIEAFRKAKAIPENTNISLHFDGDLLDPKSTIEQTELGDSDNVDIVEVYLKSRT